ncbi:hypothetical protein MsAg5_02170 [Methanosarcinaceae archaeon Ag5]|uniref:DUF4367 domain-containing protein n=1 Tax=Methanolapillus africanus TaxID=3028297 RepID=A0AAE4MHQ7_9EURY|nr:hypothetical protein [Methanosarcinaceae archaeon Ag5]
MKMNKRNIFSILLVLLALAVAVSAAGCTDTDNNTTPNGTNGTNNTTNMTINQSIVVVDPVPAGFTLQSEGRVVYSNEETSINDKLIGYQAYYQYNNSTTGAYLTVFECANATAANGYVQEMIDDNNAKYGNDSNVTTITVNGHNATLITRTVTDSANPTRYDIFWAKDNLVVLVNGPMSDLTAMESLANASKL